MTEQTLNGTTPDIAQENIEKLKQIFPDVFTEDKVDFEKLQQVLGNYIETENERYNFSWNGKARALRLSQTPSTGTLRPCKKESKDWDTTQNLYIEGDNLEVLKLLQKSYHNKVKMIYIDPPYNTGKDFVYPDDYRDNLQNYLELTGQVDSENNKISTNSEANGRYHTDWLNMMYPRLRLARNLLTDDGVIFISIDENEVDNLKKICSEVFGEENYIQEIIWEKKFAPQNDAKYFSLNHEQVLCYAKQKDLFERNLLPMTTEQVARYKNPDNDSRGLWQSDNLTVATYSAAYDFPIKKPNGEIINPPHGRCWRTSKEKFQELIDDGRIWFGSDGNGVPRIKRFLSEIQQGKVPISIFYYAEVGHTQEASKELKAIFDDKKFFDYPKPTKLIKRLIEIASNPDSLILDFFSGSSTTAHAVMQLNAEDGGNRKFIMVQLPEPCDEKSEAFKAGYRNICEIGKERIRRAGDKINTEIEENNSQLKIDEQPKQPVDIGFKVLKLDSSNIKKWNPDYENLEQSLFNSVDNYVNGRNELDVVYEIMVKYGLDLTYPVDEYDCNGKKIYSIGFGALMICLDNEVTTDVAKYILKLKEELTPEKIRVVFKDNGFKDDCNKTNVKEILKCGGIDEFVTL